MAKTERSILRQSEIRVKEETCTAGTAKDFKFTTTRGQVWEIYEVDVEAPPLTTVQIKYDEEHTGNTITFDNLYAYNFPLRFKRTATDKALILVEDRDFFVSLTNNESASRDLRVILKYIKRYPEPGVRR